MHLSGTKPFFVMWNYCLSREVSKSSLFFSRFYTAWQLSNPSPFFSLSLPSYIREPLKIQKAPSPVGRRLGWGLLNQFVTALTLSKREREFLEAPISANHIPSTPVWFWEWGKSLDVLSLWVASRHWSRWEWLVSMILLVSLNNFGGQIWWENSLWPVWLRLYNISLFQSYFAHSHN
jgi:hypothetical protein